jgi:hypothetical protein
LELEELQAKGWNGKAVDDTVNQVARTLSPDHLRLAAGAFDDALSSLPDTAIELDPHWLRRTLAKYVIEEALNGVHDRAQLKAGALKSLRDAAGSTVSASLHR